MRQPRPNLASQNKIFHSQNPASTKSYQPLQMQNPASTQSYQPMHMQNPASTTSYQPMQTQILFVHILINQRKCKMKSRYHNTYNNMK